MAQTLIYSARFAFAHNLAGDTPLTNETTGPFIISTFTAYYGGDVASFISLQDENHGVYVNVQAPGTIASGHPTNQVSTRLHLVWPAGKVVHVVSDFNWDWSLHGYQFQT